MQGPAVKLCLTPREVPCGPLRAIPGEDMETSTKLFIIFSDLKVLSLK